MYEFLDKHTLLIWVVLALCFAALLTFALIVPEFKPIDDQAAVLYSKAETVEKDFSSVLGMSDVTISFYESETEVIFKEKDCTLKMIYDKEGVVLTKMLEDGRLCNSPVGFCFAVFLVLALSAFLAFALLMVITEFCEKRYNCKKHKEQANANNEQNKIV